MHDIRPDLRRLRREIGKALYKERRAQNISLAKIQKKTGILMQNTDHIEMGKGATRMDFIVRLARFYGLKVRVVFEPYPQTEPKPDNINEYSRD